ncbi:MAG: sigma-70 family RNA polymerase sigma factor [Clostridium chrysemydis]|uniref:sigma-70 family RNA polymerase sigma factor n=1 Tax=Clostridium chrysemydis TaxID=2665504 RepID=UPI003F29F8C9
MKIALFKPRSDVYKAKKGDKDSFSKLIKENKLNLYKVSKGILKRECDIEDAIQNTIINAYENIENLREEKYFKTWLIRILINECKKILIKSKDIISLEEIQEISNKCTDDSYENLDLKDAIEKLPKETKEIILLYYFEDMKQKDIAKILNLKDSTVRTRLLRGKKKLADLMGEDYVVYE